MTDERASQNIALQFESKDGQILFTMHSADLDVTLTTTLRHTQRLGAALEAALPMLLPMLAQTFQRGFTPSAPAQEEAPTGTSTEIAAIAVASTAQLEPVDVVKLLTQVVESSGVLKVHYHDGRVRLVGLPSNFTQQLEALLEPALEAEVWVELLTQEDLDAMKYHGEFCFSVDQLCAPAPTPTDEQ